MPVRFSIFLYHFWIELQFLLGPISFMYLFCFDTKTLGEENCFFFKLVLWWTFLLLIAINWHIKDAAKRNSMNLSSSFNDFVNILYNEHATIHVIYLFDPINISAAWNQNEWIKYQSEMMNFCCFFFTLAFALNRCQ